MINSTNINLFFVSTKHSDKKNKSFFNGRRDPGWSSCIFFRRIDADKKFGYPRGRQVKTSTNKKGLPK